MAGSDEIHIRKVKDTGRITLSRPKALNALTYDMAMRIEDAILEWSGEDAVSLIVIDAEGERAFCAGGDIADLYQSGKAGDYGFGRRFWRDEYRLNARIVGLSIPYVAIMDGITMGGGVGISAHGSDRIVTERSMIAMPECGIGLVPDVGGSFILSRAPGYLGEYLALTGHRMGPGDAVFAGFADVAIAGADRTALVEALEADGDLSAIAAFAGPAATPGLSGQLAAIDRHFSAPGALECLHSLEQDESEWAQSTARQIRRACPLSVACAFEMVRTVRMLGSVEDALALEYRFTARSMSHGEFIEGVRAQIIDKDRNPRWELARLEDVTPEKVAAMLAPLEADGIEEFTGVST